MKIILLADLHIGAKQGAQVMIDHQKKFFDFMFDYIDKNNIDTIIQLGDANDGRKYANYKVINFAYECLYDVLESRKITYHTLIGNHDVFYKETLDITSSNLLLRNYKYIHVHDQPTTLCFDNVTFDIIPWICNDNQQQCLDYIANSTSDYCCGHFAINQFPVFGSVLYQEGHDRALFKHYKQVFSGHFHTRSHQANISYIGTPYQLTWSDANTSNGFVVFDTQTLTWEYIDNPDRYYYYVTYDDSNPTNTTNVDLLNLENSYVKLIVNSKSKPFLFNNFINRIFGKHPADVKIIDQQLIDLSNKTIVKQDGQVKQTIDLITDYINNSEVTDKQQLITLMQSLYNEALTMQDDIE